MKCKIQEVSFAASLDELPAIFAWIRKRCDEAGLSPEELRKTELALEEALVNVIRYAYSGKKGQVTLICEFYSGEKLRFIIKDQGIPFNPMLQKPKVDLETELQERKEGGLGIFLTENLMDEVHYERLEPFNILLLTKLL